MSRMHGARVPSQLFFGLCSMVLTQKRSPVLLTRNGSYIALGRGARSEANLILHIRIRHTVSVGHLVRQRRRMCIICMICQQIWNAMISLRRSEARFLVWTVLRLSEVHLSRRMIVRAVRPMQLTQNSVILRKIPTISIILTVRQRGFMTA